MLFNDQRASCQNFRLLALEYDEIKYPEKNQIYLLKFNNSAKGGYSVTLGGSHQLTYLAQAKVWAKKYFWTTTEQMLNFKKGRKENQ